MYSYRAYGLTLTSDTPISGLREERTPFKCPDVVMSLGPEPHWVQEAMRLPFRVDRPSAGKAAGDDSLFTFTSFGGGAFFQLAYGDGTRFVMDGSAKRLWGTCLPPLTAEDVATYLLGPIMGYVLRSRGVMALHASSVCISDMAVILCGPSESGKSTTAAALALCGIPVLAEDVSAVKEDRGSLYVEPGYPRICLWPGAVATLFGAPDALEQLTPTWEKRFLALDGTLAKFEPQRQRLGVVYLIAPRTDDSGAPRVQELDKREGLLELLQNTYMNYLLNRTQRAAELDTLARMVSTVPVRRLVPHADPLRIGAFCELILSDVERLFARPGCVALSSHE